VLGYRTGGERRRGAGGAGRGHPRRFFCDPWRSDWAEAAGRRCFHANNVLAHVAISRLRRRIAAILADDSLAVIEYPT